MILQNLNSESATYQLKLPKQATPSDFSGRFLVTSRKNGWNDDGCGKKGVLPKENVGFGFETFVKNEGSLGMENW